MNEAPTLTLGSKIFRSRSHESIIKIFLSTRQHEILASRGLLNEKGRPKIRLSPKTPPL